MKGISHQGAEYTEPYHVDLGADVLYETVLKLDETGLGGDIAGEPSGTGNVKRGRPA